MDERRLPCNCPTETGWFENYNKIVKSLTEIGGTPYEILKESGIENLEIFGLFDQYYWADINNISSKMAKNRVIALEIYIEADDSSKMDKAYLYHRRTDNYYSIYNDGKVYKGKLILTKEKLKKWAKKGYYCIIAVGENKVCEAYDTYEEIFGQRVFQRNIQPWSKKQKTASNGFKEVFLILDHYVKMNDETAQFHDSGRHKLRNLGGVCFEVDFYAIDTCFDLIRKERFIREKINPIFNLEDHGTLISDSLLNEEKGVFLLEFGYDIKDFPKCYQKLARQSAYLKDAYPDLDDLIKESSHEFKRKPIGIAIEPEFLYGAYCAADGTTELIRNHQNHITFKSLRNGAAADDIYKFQGHIPLVNPGVALSDIALSIRSILKSCIVKKVRSAVISLPPIVPEQEEIQNYMKELKEKECEHSESRISLQIYRELGLENSDTVDIIEIAAKMAGINEVKIVSRPLSVAAAYEYKKVENRIAEGELAFVYDCQEVALVITLIQRRENELEIVWQEIIKNPATYTCNDVAEGQTLLNSLKSVMKKTMDEDKMVRVFGFNEEAWDKFYASANRVLNQLLHGKNGDLVLGNSLYCTKIDYPNSDFKELFIPYYQKTETVMRNILSKTGFQNADVSKIYVSGEWGNYPYLWDCLNESFGADKACVMSDTACAPVIGAAYLAEHLFGEK